jgi:His-Xaa-Ser system radical SAM maturase HxsC
LDGRYADALADLRHPDLMIGVPVYSDVDCLHDFVVQAEGAFCETIRGLHNLARAGVPVEIRVVIHRHTYARLPQLAYFIYRNLTFASHVALMGLEVIGFAKANLRTLWIDPADYRRELSEAVELLAGVGMAVSIYNHQLCTLPTSLWPFSCRSISDWKNEYAPECADCRQRSDCGGFFAWNLTDGKSRAIGPL